ncbi:hypothetical protein MNBD_NITROSPINAE03-388 [hydrothermal vent metagenome]|uniref:Uncharacterized protein n=1 Tax=hydrothermal vent metagenome TaxID=652676 RepID=A0A3B1BZ08_9ZZZZ
MDFSYEPTYLCGFEHNPYVKPHNPCGVIRFNMAERVGLLRAGRPLPSGFQPSRLFSLSGGIALQYHASKSNFEMDFSYEPTYLCEFKSNITSPHITPVGRYVVKWRRGWDYCGPDGPCPQAFQPFGWHCFAIPCVGVQF